MYLCSLQLLWAQTMTTVILCLLVAVFQVSSQDQKLTSATLTASMSNSNNATILFNNTTMTSFHDCLCKTDTLRCIVNINYTYHGLNYTAESAQIIRNTATDHDAEEYGYVCIIPHFRFIPGIPSAITCTRLNKTCSNSNKNKASWSIKLDNVCTVELIWIDQEISFYTHPPGFVKREKENDQCPNLCDYTCLRNTALQGIVSPTPAEETTSTSSNADGNEDTSTNHAGIIAGVIFAVLIVAALIIIGVIFWKRRSRNLNSSKAVTTRGQERFPATNERSPAPFSSDSSSVSQMANSHKQGTHAYDTVNGDGGNYSGVGIGNRSPYETIKDHDNNNTGNGTSVYSEVSATDANKNDGFTGVVPVSGSNNTNLSSCNRNSDGDTSQYTYIDGTDLHRNEYNRLGEETKNFAHPYNDLLNPKEDPKRRSPIPTPDTSKQQTSSYSLAQPIVDGASSQRHRPTEVIDLAHPAYKPTNERPEKGKFKVTDKSANDYDYPSDEEMPKPKEQRYFELEKEEDIAEPYTTGGENDRPYFELEKVDDSDTYYGSGYPNHGFDANE